MSKIKVLIPTDFSVQAHFAWLMAQKLAEKIDLEVTFLHVIDTPSHVQLDKSGQPMSDGENDISMYLRMQDVAKEKLGKLKEDYGNTITSAIKFGPLTQTICSTADGNFDLLIMGTRGARGIQEALSGSETQHVVRHCRIPVLSLMCDRSELVIRNILLVHDFRLKENYDLKLLKAIQQAFGTKIHLLQIAASNDRTDESQLKQFMQDFANDNQLSNTEFHVLKDSDVETGVMHFVQMKEMDMLCIGTHGRSGWKQLLSPSVAEKLVNHLFKPIITFNIH
jgi:nucleotide-binding universal stress UspA family protein